MWQPWCLCSAPVRRVVAFPSICGFWLLVQKQRHKKSGCLVFAPGCAGAYGSSYGSGYGGNSMYGSTSMYGGSGFGMNSGYGSGYGGSSLYGGGGYGEPEGVLPPVEAHCRSSVLTVAAARATGGGQQRVASCILHSRHCALPCWDAC